MTPALSSIILYTPKIDEMASFYCDFFSYKRHDIPGDRLVELRSPGPGAILLLHLAAKGMRQGQAAVKLTFTSQDVAGFCEACAQKGLKFGTLHQADGYVFANTKDPSGNSVSVSGRFSGQ